MANFYADEKEWEFLVEHGIDWDRIIPLYYPEFPTADGFQSKEEVIGFAKEMLTATGDWSGNAVANRAEALDREGAGKVENGNTIPGKNLSALYEEAKELAIFGLTAKTHLGGMGAPLTLGLLIFTQLNRACIASATQIGFYTSIIDMIERFCDNEDQKRLVPQIIAGDLSGSMCLTEPGAGSDVGALSTSAEKQADGSYLINGAKIFITNGGGGLGFVLARIKGAPKGLKGISLFLVEQYIDKDGEQIQNYKVTKNEDKMGLHGSFTCEVLYENSIGKLIGKEHHGFRYMLHLMNEARCGVGLQCLGGIEACIGYARVYSEERSQFGKPISELPLMKRNLEDWECERDAFRALMVDTLVEFDVYQFLDMKNRHGDLSTEEQRKFKEASKVVRRRTPLVKYYGSEAFTLLSQRTIQTLGGYGFMREYSAERWHRDSFAPLLYEGTSQIQALMALKDLMKFIMRDPAKFFRTLINSNPMANIFSTTSEAQKEFLSVQYEFKKNLVKLIIKTLRPEVNYADPTEVRKFFNAKEWLQEENFEKLMVHAETICQGLSYIETLRVLSKHALKDESRADLLVKYRVLTAPRFASIFSDWSVR